MPTLRLERRRSPSPSPPPTPRHFYYRNDGVAGGVTTADIAVTTATDDATIAGIDPDWPHSWYSIEPDSDLPEIIETTTIDGYSQPGSRQNTLSAPGPLNTVLKIELDGTNAPGVGLNVGNGLGIDAGNSRIDGLAINRFGGDGIELDTLNGGVAIMGNFIGTDISGMIALGNGRNGVFLNFEEGDLIGSDQPGDSNLISGNEVNGIDLLESAADIVGNLIGVDRVVAAPIENGVGGIDEHSSDDESSTDVDGAPISALSAVEAPPEPGISGINAPGNNEVFAQAYPPFANALLASLTKDYSDFKPAGEDFDRLMIRRNLVSYRIYGVSFTALLSKRKIVVVTYIADGTFGAINFPTPQTTSLEPQVTGAARRSPSISAAMALPQTTRATPTTVPTGSRITRSSPRPRRAYKRSSRVP